MSEPTSPDNQTLEGQRLELLHRVQDWLETPMLVLAFVWLALFVVEIIWGLNPLLETAGAVIWVSFILDFALGFTLAPHKGGYLKANWLKAIALLAPALRAFRLVSLLRTARVARVAGATRGLRLLRVVSSLNRGMRAFGASMSRRGFGYMVGLTLIVTLVGAAGMYSFESNPAGAGLNSYGEALWWTGMMMTTMGSEYWPQTAEGRVLCFLLALYAFAVFGYATAALATWFIGRDAENDGTELAGAKQLTALRDEISGLRSEIRVLSRRPPES